MVSPKVVLLIFVSGKIVITGAKVCGEMLRVRRILVLLLGLLFALGLSVVCVL